ncbi:MAG: hypothetical protein ABSD38_00010 [Syntrophorhabdales bacterium]|jgi:hypothetical protein
MNKYSRIRLYLRRSKSFADRTISLLKRMKIEKGFSKEVADFERRLLNAGVESEEVYDQSVDFSSSLADEYMLLANGMYSAVLTALYNLWEHDIKDLCKHKLLLSDVAVAENGKLVTDQAIQNYKYVKIKSLLMYFGVQESIFDKINLLRLVVNTIKHGAGPSATELLTTSRKYYCKLALFRDLEITEVGIGFDQLEALDIDDIEYFGVVLVTFWAELGEQISI